MKKLQTKMQNIDCFCLTIFISVSAKKPMRKKSKEDEQTLEDRNSAHLRSQAKCQLKQTSYVKRIKLLLFPPYNKHLINRAKSVCMGETWPWSLYRPHCVRSVLTTSVKILPYRPLARLIRAKYKQLLDQSDCMKLFVQLWNYTKTS